MVNLLIFSIIVGVVFSLVIVPFILSAQVKRGADEARETVRAPFNRGVAIATVAILSAVAVFVFYYTTNMDRNWTSLWMGLLVVTLLGVLSAGGKDRKVKTSCSWAHLFLGHIYSVRRYLTLTRNTKRLKWISKWKSQLSMKQKRQQVFHRSLPAIR